MDENKFVSGMVEALSEQITILDSIEISVREAAAEYSELPNLPEIFKIIAETAEHCGTALERYWPDKLPPSDLSDRTARALGSISGVANALSLYSSTVNLRITA